MSYPHITSSDFESLLVFAARCHFDEPTATCTAWFRGDQGCVTILIDGESKSLAWNGEALIELPNVHRCAECGCEPGAGVFWDDDDWGRPYEAGCGLCHELEAAAAAE